MTNRLIAAAALAAVALGATACTSTADAKPTPVRTITAKPTPADTPEPTDTADAETAILDGMWGDLPKKTKTTMCDGFLLRPDFVLDNFLDQLSTEGYDMKRSTARKFFNTRCADLY